MGARQSLSSARATSFFLGPDCTSLLVALTELGYSSFGRRRFIEVQDCFVKFESSYYSQAGRQDWKAYYSACKSIELLAATSFQARRLTPISVNTF